MTARQRPIFDRIVRAGRLRSVTALTICAVVMSNVFNYVLCRLLFPDIAFNRDWALMATLIPALVAPPICLLIVDLLIINDEKSKLLERAALVDPLTGAFNRRHFNDAFVAWSRAAGEGPAVASAILIDIDEFKAINDRWGHSAGDRVIIEVAHRCTALIRRGDVFARHGGEEYAALLPGAHPDEARIIAERMRSAVANTAVQWDGMSIPVTISLGVVTAALDPAARRLESLLRIADDRLYSAKSAGRNRVAYAEAA